MSIEPLYLNLLICPGIQSDRLDTGDVCAELAMEASAANAEEHTNVPGCPSGSLQCVNMVEAVNSWAYLFVHSQHTAGWRLL